MKNDVNVKFNLLKGFACIGVVFIHITFPGLFGQIVLYSSAYAVPIFLMIAGYYAYGKGHEVIIHRLIKIIKIFLYAYTLFLIYNLACAVKEHDLVTWLGRNFNWKTPIKYIWFCTIDFAIPLWYLIAMIEIYIVWLIVVRKGKEFLFVKLIPVLFCLQIILQSYCETMKLDWFLKINFITSGMPWFLLGYYLCTSEGEWLRNVKTYKLILMVIVGCSIAIIPTTFDLSYKFNVIGYIPYAYGLFVLALHNPGKSKCKPMEFIGEKLSLNIYIFHVLINGIIGFLLRKIVGIDTTGTLYLWIRPIIVLGITMVASYTVYRISCIAKKKIA